MAIDRNGTASETLSGRVVRLGQVGKMGAAIRAVYQHVIDHDGGSKPEECGLGLRHDEEHQWFACRGAAPRRPRAPGRLGEHASPSSRPVARRGRPRREAGYARGSGRFRPQGSDRLRG